jgi:hypothetical protein
MATKLKKNPGNRNLIQALGLNYRVAPFIDKYIDENPEYPWTFTLEPKIGDDAFHPSGDCTPSVYELWYSRKFPEPRKLTISNKKTFSIGHYYHQWLQDILVRIKFSKPEELEVRGGYHWDTDPEVMSSQEWSDCNILYPSPRNAWGLFDWSDELYLGKLKPRPYHWCTGSADAIVTLPDGAQPLIDFKSMASRDMQVDYPPERYVKKWECQGAMYCEWHDKNEIIFIGVNKDSPHNLKEFTFKSNPNLVRAIYEKWQIVSMALDEDIELQEDDDIDLESFYKGPVTV